MSRMTPVELKILDIANIVTSEYYRDPKALKDAILHPDLIGPVKMHTINGPLNNLAMGIMYRLGHAKNDNETNVEGLILDVLGLGYILGTKFNDSLTGIQGFKFQRFPLDLSGRSDTVALRYECSTPVSFDDRYEGRFTGMKRGEFGLMKGKHENDGFMYEMLDHYYDMLIENLTRSQAETKEAQGVKNG